MRSERRRSHALTQFLRDEAAASPMELALIGAIVLVVCLLLGLALNKGA